MVTLCPERGAPGLPRPPGRDDSRPLWWREVGLIALGYVLYTLTRNAAPLHVVAAHHHASAILAVERWLHLDIELTLNGVLSGHHWLSSIASYYYATLHFVVTVGVLVWVYRRHPAAYRQARTVLIGTTLVALFVFWVYPLAPPRLSGFGFVDTIGTVRLWGGATWNSPGIASVSNEYAAMPSLHVAWAVWSAGVVLRSGAHRQTWQRLIRRLIPLYPGVTLIVVLATANHFVLDAVGAVGVLGVVTLAQSLSLHPEVQVRVRAAQAAWRNRGLVERPRVGAGGSGRRQVGTDAG